MKYGMFVTSLFFSLSAFCTTYYKLIPPLAFRPEIYYDTVTMPSNAMKPEYNGDWIKATLSATPTFPATMKLDAVIEVPDTSDISGFECYILDNDPVVNFDSTSQVQLKSKVPLTGASGVLAQALIGQPGPGIIRIVPTTILTHVNTQTTFYYAELTWVFGSLPADLTLLQFRGCRIQYEL